MATQEYTIGHDAATLGSSAVSRNQNQVSPQRESSILELSCPENFDEIDFVPQRDAVRAELRSKETFDGDGSTSTFSLSADLIPVTGEPDLDDQPYPAVVVTVGGSEVAIGSIDYAANEVTLDSAPAAGTDNVAFFPLLTDGTIKARGVNTLGQVQGPLYPWGHPVYRWADMHQYKRGQTMTLPWPAFSWQRNETLEFLVDSDQQVVWTDSQYPDAYVSSFNMDVEITF